MLSEAAAAGWLKIPHDRYLDPAGDWLLSQLSSGLQVSLIPLAQHRNKTSQQQLQKATHEDFMEINNKSKKK